jgi:ATP-dependent DNA helicase RecQ
MIGFAMRRALRDAHRSDGGALDRVTVLFDEHGYRTLSMAAVQEGDLLTIDSA